MIGLRLSVSNLISRGLMSVRLDECWIRVSKLSNVWLMEAELVNLWPMNVELNLISLGYVQGVII